MTSCLLCDARLRDGARFCDACGAAIAGLRAPDAPQLSGDRYQVVRRLGEGGMGVVWEAEQRLGAATRRVAVKVLHPSLGADRAVATRFHRECGMLARLEHPNTIELLDFGATADGGLFYAMELLPGRPLAAEIARGPLSVARVVNVVRQIAAALDEAHALGIVHRDLKPDNVFLVERAGDPDFVKVLDFGIARDATHDAHATKLTRAGAVLGTPPYMSPEQFSGSPVDRRSDVYALGIVAYELLTGRLPFSATTAWEWARCHTAEPPAPLDGVEPPVARVVGWALSKRREARPETAGALARALTDAWRSGRFPAATAASMVTTERGDEALTAVPTVPAPTLPARIRTEGAVSADVVGPPRGPRRGRTAALVGAAGALVLIAAGGGRALVHQDDTTALPVDVAPPRTVLVPLAPSATDPVTEARTPQDETAAGAGAPRPSTTREAARVAPMPAPAPTPPRAQPDAVPATPGPAPAPPAAPGPTSAPSAVPGPPPAATAAPDPLEPSGDAACSEGVALATGGAIEAAAARYHRCRATGGSPAAVRSLAGKLRAVAPSAARAAAFNGDCDRARSIARSVAGVTGAAAPTAAAVAATRCAA